MRGYSVAGVCGNRVGITEQPKQLRLIGQLTGNMCH